MVARNPAFVESGNIMVIAVDNSLSDSNPWDRRGGQISSEGENDPEFN